MIFIDGENLLNRFETMYAEEGSRMNTSVHYAKGRFVWHPDLAEKFKTCLVRITYYTAFSGDTPAIEQLESEIARIRYIKRESEVKRDASLVPAVFKKERKSSKTKSVDINLTTDLLRSAYNDSLDRAVLISGDGDYLPVVKDVMRQGKEVWVAALSSGLNRALPSAADHFLNLDQMFFGGMTLG